MESQKKVFDVNELIRSFQRREGNPDCFGKANGYCDQLECSWRAWCLKIEQPLEKKAG